MSNLICLVGCVSKKWVAGVALGMTGVLVSSLASQWSDLITQFPKTFFVMIERQIRLNTMGGGC